MRDFSLLLFFSVSFHEMENELSDFFKNFQVHYSFFGMQVMHFFLQNMRSASSHDQSLLGVVNVCKHDVNVPVRARNYFVFIHFRVENK